MDAYLAMILFAFVVAYSGGVLFGLAGLFASRKKNLTAWRSLSLVAGVALPLALFYLQPTPPGDVYGWGTFIIPELLAGVCLPFAWAGGARQNLRLIFLWQFVTGAITIYYYTGSMDNYGYGVAYWLGHLQYGMDPALIYTRMRESFDRQVSATAVYLLLASLLMVAPYSLNRAATRKPV